MAGIVQEQHPERAALYLQWQKMDWPVLADPFNELQVKVVPIVLLVDEAGVIRFRNPKMKQVTEFLATNYQSKKSQPIPKIAFDHRLETLKKQTGEGAASPHDWFRLGVAYRQRFDSAPSGPADFGRAIDCWSKALALDPSQYIWRRRLQQYGPRLDKPYPFYNWVREAQREIKARGESPVPLKVRLAGAETAQPARRSKVSEKATPHPDPEGKVPRDRQGLVSIQPVLVAATGKKRTAARIHFTLAPSQLRQVRWEDEAGKPTFHLEPGQKLSLQ